MRALGNYPKKKQDVVGDYVSEELRIALETLNSINDPPKENIVSVVRGSLGYLQRP
ncbi:MAG: hypothetical protein KJ939_00345 [Nanoarchaeota archaeon]|nr:hypothetical protein [Nanoarchaeota archaeon]MCG2719733.1 hypothetical protein [Nanoarchaeota archaeon]